MLVSDDDQITPLLEKDGEDTTTVDLEAGTARIILVGDHADGSCKINLTNYSNVTIQMPSEGLESKEWINDFFND